MANKDKAIELKIGLDDQENQIVDHVLNYWDNDTRKKAIAKSSENPKIKTVLDNPYETVFNILESQGIAEMHISFSGGNDSGGADSYTVIRKKNYKKWKEQIEQGDYSQITQSLTEIVDNQNIDKTFQTFAEKPIYNKYHGFAWHGHVDGFCVWNVEEKTVSLKGEERNNKTHTESYDL